MLSPIQREHLDLIRNTAHGILRPREVLADARNPNSPLHGLFLWNDSEAAEAYRLQQAKQVIKVAVRFVPRAPVAPQRVVISERPSQPMQRQTAQPTGETDADRYVRTSIRRVSAYVDLADTAEQIDHWSAVIGRSDNKDEVYAISYVANSFVQGIPTPIICDVAKGMDDEEWTERRVREIAAKYGLRRPPRWDEALAGKQWEQDEDFSEHTVYGMAKYEPAAPKPPPHFPGADRPGNGTLSRFKPYTHGEAHADKERAALPAANAALTEQRTLFPSRVFNPDGADHVLISGHNNAKIGAFVTKGPWAGMDIYTLTMEERATCPTECHLWAECYGNAMPLAKRWEYGPKLIAALGTEIEEKSREHPAGFVVRLHVLGDFPDLDYVEQWHAWLKAYPQVHVFGYTAHPRFGLVGQALADMNRDFPNRWAIRFSVAPETPEQPMQATAIWRKAWGKVDEGIVCPASSGDTEACGTCGLCWHPAAADRRIVFLGHGMNRTQGGRPPGAQAGPDSKEITLKADIGNPITEQNQQVVERAPTDKGPVHKVEGITPSKGVAQTDTPPPPSGGGGVIAGGLKVSRPPQAISRMEVLARVGQIATTPQPIQLPKASRPVDTLTRDGTRSIVARQAMDDAATMEAAPATREDVVAWAKANKIGVGASKVSLSAVNDARRGFGLPPFRLVVNA